MGKYNVLIRKSAVDELRRILKKDLQRIVEGIEKLGEEPRPRGSEKLSAQERYRLPQGDYRIIYAVDDSKQSVEIVKIGHRSEIYKK